MSTIELLSRAEAGDPIADMCWLGIAPCGCVEGISTTRRIRTVEAAEKRLIDKRKAVREQMRRDGWHVEMVTAGEGRARFAGPLGCDSQLCVYRDAGMSS